MNPTDRFVDLVNVIRVSMDVAELFVLLGVALAIGIAVGVAARAFARRR